MRLAINGRRLPSMCNTLALERRSGSQPHRLPVGSGQRRVVFRSSVGLLLLHMHWLRAAVFVLGLSLSIWLRRFGAAVRRAGSLIALPFVVLRVTAHAHAARPVRSRGKREQSSPCARLMRTNEAKASRPYFRSIALHSCRSRPRNACLRANVRTAIRELLG